MNLFSRTHPSQNRNPALAKHSHTTATPHGLNARIKKVKAALLAEFSDALESNTHLLRLALNEAEAMAWQSEVPQLVFPVLAREKALAVVAWQKRQRSVYDREFSFAE